MTEKLYKSKVSYYETDCMNIVHHSNYIRYFEDARIQYMHDIGCDVAEMQSKGLYIPNVDAYARYKKPLKFGDEFSVEVSLVFFTGSRMIFDYKITRIPGCARCGDQSESSLVGENFYCRKCAPAVMRRDAYLGM